MAHLYALEAVPEYMDHYINCPIATEDAVAAIFDYSNLVEDVVPSIDMARAEFSWRNGFFLWRQPTNTHLELLKQAGFSDLVSSSSDA